MAIPKFDETFMPILKFLQDGKVVKTSELPNKLLEENYFQLTDDELAEKTTTGTRLFFNRVSWGKAFLKQGKYLEQPERGLVKISEKGSQLLENGRDLSLEELKKDDDYIAHQKRVSIAKDKEKAVENGNVSPQDMIDFGFKDIRNSLKADLLEKLKTTNPYYFEDIILVLFQKMGYGDFQRTSKSNDGGVDGIINQDKLGVEKIYTQAKRFSNDHQVGSRDMVNFIGAISRDGVTKGIFVTTSTFSESARETADKARDNIILVDGDKLVDLMIDYNVGVQVKTNYEIKEIDEDFFEEKE